MKSNNVKDNKYKNLCCSKCKSKHIKKNGKRKTENRGRGANNKAIAFGILERKGKVHTIIIENVKAETLMEAIESKTKKGSVFYTNGFRSYNDLKQYGKQMLSDMIRMSLQKRKSHKRN